MANKYAGNCIACGKRVPSRAGQIIKIAGKWNVHHNHCAVATDAERKASDDNRRNTAMWVNHMRPRVIVAEFNSGEYATVNSRGRCEDAPCCGCCT